MAKKQPLPPSVQIHFRNTVGLPGLQERDITSGDIVDWRQALGRAVGDEGYVVEKIGAPEGNRRSVLLVPMDGFPFSSTPATPQALAMKMDELPLSNGRTGPAALMPRAS